MGTYVRSATTGAYLVYISVMSNSNTSLTTSTGNGYKGVILLGAEVRGVWTGLVQSGEQLLSFKKFQSMTLRNNLIIIIIIIAVCGGKNTQIYFTSIALLVIPQCKNI